jgi:hypothetical protein
MRDGDGGVDADALVARVTGHVTDTAAATYSLEWQSKADGANRAFRIYAHKNGSVAFTQNALWTGFAWAKDVAGFAAMKLTLDGSIGLAFYSKETDENVSWSDSAWGPSGGNLASLTVASASQLSGDLPDMTLLTKTLSLLASGGTASLDMNALGDFNVDNGGINIDRNMFLGRLITSIGTLFQGSGEIDLPRYTVNVRSDGATGPTGLVATKQSAGGLADITTYFDGLTKDIELLYNAKRDPANPAEYIRHTASFPSFRAVFKQDDADRLNVQFQVRGPSLASPWTEGAWRRAFQFAIGDTDHATSFDRSQLILRDTRVKFDLVGPVAQPVATVDVGSNVALALNMLQAWARVTITAGVPALTDGFNIFDAGIAGTALRVRAHPGFGGGTLSALMLHVSGRAGETVSYRTTGTSVGPPSSIDAVATADSVELDMGAAGTTLEVFVAFIGRAS